MGVLKILKKWNKPKGPAIIPYVFYYKKNNIWASFPTYPKNLPIVKARFEKLGWEYKGIGHKPTQKPKQEFVDW